MQNQSVVKVLGEKAVFMNPWKTLLCFVYKSY